MTENKPTQQSLEKAAQVWCRKDTKHIVMDVELATAFAYVLDDVLRERDELRKENEVLNGFMETLNADAPKDAEFVSDILKERDSLRSVCESLMGALENSKADTCELHCTRENTEALAGGGEMKRKDKYLVGYLATRNPVYGREHRAKCERYESPMTLPEAKKALKSLTDGVSKIFKLVPVKS